MLYLKNCFYIFTLFLTISALTTNQSITSYTELCKKSSPKFNKCMKNALQLFLNDLNKDSIDGENLDPWEMPELPLVYDAGSSDRMSVTLKGVTIHGLSQLLIKNIRTNLKDNSKLRMEIDLHDKHIYIDGNYSAELISNTESPISAEGTFNITLTNLRGTLVLKGRTIQRDGDEYLMVDRASIRPELDNLYVDIVAENDPYPELTSLVLSLINQYWRLVYFEALPLLEEGLDAIIRSYIDQAVWQVPYNQLVPP